MATDTSLIFLAGAGRSGTTLLRVMLDSHPNIACGPEFKLLPSIAQHWERTVTAFSGIMELYNLNMTDVNTAYMHFVEELLSKYKARSGKQRLAEKSPNNVFFFPHFGHMFPDSPLIHVIRDGRDVVSSLLTMDWQDINTGKKLPYVESAEGAASYWVEAVTKGRNSARLDQVKDRYYEIRYEDLVRKPEKVLRPLFKFINEPWDPVVLDYHEITRELGQESSAAQVSRPLEKKPVGRWKTDLNDQDKVVVKRIAGKLLIELGYAVDDAW